MNQSYQENIYVVGMLGTPPYTIKYEEIKTNSRKLWVASCPIGRDAFGEYVVTIDSLLDQRVGWPIEFKFGISKNPLKECDKPIRFFSSNSARPYVPENERSKVIDIVAESLTGLIGRARPKEVFRQLKEPHKKSMRVHECVSEVFTMHGYTIEYRWPDKSDRQWMHVLRP